MEATATKATVQKYPAYKDSGVEWLGEIPEHWQAKKLKYLFRDVSEKNKPEAELLSVTQDQGVVPRTWVENRMVMPSGNLESFKFIRKGDFAISLRSFEGGLEYCHHDGIISPAYTVLKKKNGLIDGYYKFLFKSKSFISEIQTSVVGIREGKNISYFELSYSLLPIPSPLEQTAIANFLDDKTTKIDRAIAQKEKMITLLKERKQIIIQDLVTGKKVWNEKQNAWTEPAEVKDSGVDWLEELPKNWDEVPLFTLTKLKSVINCSELELLSVYLDLGVIKFSDVEAKRTNVTSQDLSKYQRVDFGDFVLNNQQAWRGSVGVSNHQGIVSPAYLVLELSKKLHTGYANYMFRSGYMVGQYLINSKGVGTIQRNLYWPSLRRAKVILPPLPEQTAIVTHIETQSAKIDKAIKLQEQQIEKLKELKSTLIDGAVTGKIKII